jgi:hypothetical protein
MGLIAGRPDFIDRALDVERTQRRIRTAQPGRAAANFIARQIGPGDFPAAATPPRCRIIGVLCRLGSGGPVTVDMMVVRLDPPADEPNPFNLHTFTVSGDGLLVYEEVGIDLELLDYIYPSVTAGTGENFTASYIVAP